MDRFIPLSVGEGAELGALYDYLTKTNVIPAPSAPDRFTSSFAGGRRRDHLRLYAGMIDGGETCVEVSEEIAEGARGIGLCFYTEGRRAERFMEILEAAIRRFLASGAAGGRRDVIHLQHDQAAEAGPNQLSLF